MTTTVTFDIHSNDDSIVEAVESIKGDPVATWRLAVFVAQQQLEKALAAEAIRKHYDTIHFRARATRERNREQQEVQDPEA